MLVRNLPNKLHLHNKGNSEGDNNLKLFRKSEEDSTLLCQVLCPQIIYSSISQQKT